MRLWTVQPLSVLDQINERGVYHCDPKKSEYLTSFGKNFLIAYNWLAGQMRRRIGLPPFSVKYPVWAWHTFDGKHKRPDLRQKEFLCFSEEMVCIEAEVPDHKVLLSDEETWHIILNDAYIPSSDCPEDIELEHIWLSTLAPMEQKKEKLKSWERVLINSRDIPQNVGYIQATFWELRKEQIISTIPIRCRKKKPVSPNPKKKRNNNTKKNEVTKSGK